MCAMASQITGVSIVCSTVGSGADQRNHQSPASLVFVWGEFPGDRWIPRTKGLLRRKCFHLMTSSWHRFSTDEGIIFFQKSRFYAENHWQKWDLNSQPLFPYGMHYSLTNIYRPCVVKKRLTPKLLSREIFGRCFCSITVYQIIIKRGLSFSIGNVHKHIPLNVHNMWTGEYMNIYNI